MDSGTDLSRRDLLYAGAAAIFVGRIPVSTEFREEDEMEVLEARLVDVPAAIPEKVYSTERVGISRRTHDEHLKLWQGYANKTNEIRKALAEMEVDPTKANQIYSMMRALKVDYTFAYEGFVNHNIYFETLGGSGGEATGKIADLIRVAYGSFDKWVVDWKATGMAARGWVYLAYDHAEKRVFNYIGDAQNSFPIWNHTCVLAMDVYEHAYYLDFATARMKYIEAYLQVIDWDAVNRRGERVVLP
ncbi:MAG TPA: Fe-Mn family superoxide dismutase [Fimbriimonadaceae bacterium]|nr:Fe-Mn family superoxide dismutase [Fimbriimonadaceae bacterium]HRJ95501.1 Fe-Mn family superoxide dismutase [Fimbriimonadaceae bacterium]